MITLKDYLMDRVTPEELSDQELSQANILLEKVNELLSLFNEERKCTSGFRSRKDHTRIYKQINAQRVKRHLPPVSIPWGSKHLSCEAIDVEDANRKLKKWCLTNLPELERLGLWIEAPEATPTWVHFQIVPPKSGNRIFNP